MEQIDYVKYLPEPPADLALWVQGKGTMKKQYLIYRASWEKDPLTDMRQQVVEVVCTACGKRFLADKISAGGCHNSYTPAPFGWQNTYINEPVISGMDTVCPCCGTEAHTVHVGQFRDYIYDYEYVTQPVRLVVPGVQDRLGVIEWQITRRINKGGKVEYCEDLWTAWVVEDRKVVRIRGYKKFMSSCYTVEPYQAQVFLDDYGKLRLLYDWDSDLLIGTTGENCKLDRYIAQGGQCLIAYLALWRKRPALENLIMQGLGGLVEEWINGEQTHGTYSRNKGIPRLQQIDWKEKKPNRMLHLSKEEFRKHRTELNADMLHCISAVRGAGIEMSIEKDWPRLKHHGNYWLSEILSMKEPRWFWKTVEYLETKKVNLTTYRDYIKMAVQIGLDLENLQVRFPKNLKKAHDDAVKQYKHQVSKELEAGFAARYKHLQQYAWEQNGILIRPAMNENELVIEGKLLSHCVASYAERHAKGSTAIFFVRKTEAPDDPWYTLEFKEDKLTVVQNRGKHNCARTPEVKAFEDAWLEHVKELINKNIRRKSA